MNKVNDYSEKLKHPKWQKKRLEIMQRDGFKCKLCGDTETQLHVHHLEYGEGEPWEIENKKLITLCEHCHAEIETIKNKFKDDFDFNEVNIRKIRWDLGGITLFIRYKECFILRNVSINNTGLIIDEEYNKVFNYIYKKCQNYITKNSI